MRKAVQQYIRSGNGGVPAATRPWIPPADMSVILTWWQIQDGIADHGLFQGLKYRCGGHCCWGGLSEGAAAAARTLTPGRRSA